MVLKDVLFFLFFTLSMFSMAAYAAIHLLCYLKDLLTYTTTTKNLNNYATSNYATSDT